MSQAPPTDLLPYFLALSDLPLADDGRLDWEDLFGNGNPVEIDVGCGRGMFLVNSSLARPDTNFLGIELDFVQGRHGAKRLKRRQIENARVLGGSVQYVFGKLIRPASVAAIHVYFPDPWWKRKHRRRRVFTDELADQAALLLQPAGRLHSWTDVEDYFEVIAGLMDHHPEFETLPRPEGREPVHDLDYLTSFERKRRKAGANVWRGEWRRR